ncbi:MAG: type II toxin-antitoxin system VapC family toxin [Variibacter sp.]
MRFVLDASVAASWCFQDENDVRANAALELLQGDAHAVAPMHWWFEIRNVLLGAVRRKRIAELQMAGFLDRLAKGPITLAELPNASAVLAVARNHRLSFYDAAYFELAKREDIALATLDTALVQAARSEAVPLIGMS